MEPIQRDDWCVVADWPGVPDPEQDQPGSRRIYTAPRLRVVGSAADLLEVLGPAQANYGGM